MALIKSDKIVTPKLRLLYNGLVTPYYHTEKGVTSKKGKYSITLVAAPAEIDEFRERMDEVHEDLMSRLAEQEGKKKMQRKDPLGGIYPHTDREGEETGDFCVKLSHADKGFNAKTGKEWAIAVQVFDSQKMPVSGEVVKKLGRGSIIRCSFSARAYMMGGIAGVAYDLVATQIIVPQWYTGGDTSDDFDAVDDGFAASVDEQQEF